MRWLLTVLIALVVCSCRIQEKRAEKCHKWGVCADIDSTSYVETLTTDTILMDDSQMWLDFLFECDSMGNVLTRTIYNLQTENSDLQMKLKDNRLTVYIKSPNDTIYHYGKDIVKYEQKILEKRVNYMTWWQRAFMWVGIILLPLFGLVLVIKIKKLFTWIDVR